MTVLMPPSCCSTCSPIPAQPMQHVSSSKALCGMGDVLNPEPHVALHIIPRREQEDSLRSGANARS